MEGFAKRPGGGWHLGLVLGPVDRYTPDRFGTGNAALHVKLLPPEVLSRPKRGFDVPVGRWLRSDLKDAMREIITTQNFVTDRLDREKLERMFSDHVSGREDQGRFFWALLMLNEWSRTIKRERFVGTG